MRVLHVDTALTWRGGQQQVYLLHRELLRHGVDSRLLARGELLERCRGEGLPAGRLRGRMVWDPRAVAPFLGAAGRTPLIHVHDARAHALAAVARAVRPETRLVCHRRVSYTPGRSLASRWKRDRVDGWVAVSREVARVLETAGVRADAVAVVHSAIEVASLQAQAGAVDPARLRLSLDIPGPAPVIGFAAAFTGQKGHTVLVEAARGVLQAVPDAVFLLPGDGHLLAAVRGRVADLGMLESFRFPGFRRDVAAITASFTVGVVPSVDGEGSPASIKEPMALGVPVVASDLPSNLEVLDGAGLSFGAGDAAGLARQLLRLLGDAELRGRLAQAGRDRARAFTPAAMVDGVLRVYEKIA